MAAPRGAVYVGPSTSALPGRRFVGTPGTTQAYNRFLQANARALGFGSYRQQKLARQSGSYRTLIRQESAGGKPPPIERRNDLLRAFAERQRIEVVEEPGKRPRQRFTLDVDYTDKSRGGSYDMYLRRIGRRVGNEEWPPGETPH